MMVLRHLSIHIRKPSLLLPFIDLYILDLQVEEWITKGNSFVETVKNFRLISKRLVELPNFSAVQELFPYVWDLLGIFETCAGYISWLSKFFIINLF